MRARCADGPYAGQTFEITVPQSKIHWDDDLAWTGPLMWIIDGPRQHAYTMAQNGHYGTFRLVYRDSW